MGIILQQKIVIFIKKNAIMKKIPDGDFWLDSTEMGINKFLIDFVAENNQNGDVPKNSFEPKSASIHRKMGINHLFFSSSAWFFGSSARFFDTLVYNIVRNGYFLVFFAIF